MDEKFEKSVVWNLKEDFPENVNEVMRSIRLYVTRHMFFSRSAEYKEKSASPFLFSSTIFYLNKR